MDHSIFRTCHFINGTNCASDFNYNVCLNCTAYTRHYYNFLYSLERSLKYENYFHGRAILFAQQIGIGTPIQTKTVAGKVTEVGRLGIRIRNSEGLHFVNYASLLK